MSNIRYGDGRYDFVIDPTIAFVRGDKAESLVREVSSFPESIGQFDDSVADNHTGEILLVGSDSEIEAAIDTVIPATKAFLIEDWRDGSCRMSTPIKGESPT